MPTFTNPVTFVFGLVSVAAMNRLNTMISELQAEVTPSAYSNLTLIGGFTASTVTPQVRIEGDRCYAGGRINGTMTSATQIATIPVGFRPAAAGAGGPTGLDFYGFVVPCGTGTAQIRVYPSGALSVYNPSPSGAQTVDLSTVHWPIA